MNKIVTQKPFSSNPISYEENLGAIWRQFISEVLVRKEVKSIHSFQIVPTGKGTCVILVLANISTTQQWEEADPFLVEENEEENIKSYVGYARVPEKRVSQPTMQSTDWARHTQNFPGDS